MILEHVHTSVFFYEKESGDGWKVTFQKKRNQITITLHRNLNYLEAVTVTGVKMNLKTARHFVAAYLGRELMK